MFISAFLLMWFSSVVNFFTCLHFQDEAALADKQKELSKVESMFVQLKTADEEDSKALAEAQRKFQAVSAGLLTTDDGQEATLQEQLMSKFCNQKLRYERTMFQVV